MLWRTHKMYASQSLGRTDRNSTVTPCVPDVMLLTFNLCLSVEYYYVNFIATVQTILCLSACMTLRIIVIILFHATL